MFKRAALLLAAVFAAGTLAAAPAAASQPLATNVIVMIDDGAGYNHHIAGSLYDTGLPDGEAYNGFPFQFGVSTYSMGDVAVGICPDPVGYDPALAWSSWEYVTLDPTDSAAAATALATGVKTYDKAIGVDCDGLPRENVVETYEKLGKATGVVSSVPFNHATPAAFVAHNQVRDDYLTIAHDMIEHSATDVIMGGGHPWYNRFGTKLSVAGYQWIAKEDYDRLVGGTAGGDADGDLDVDPWSLVVGKSAFQALMTGETPNRVFGLPQVRRTLQQDRLRAPVTNPDAFTYPQIAVVPSLAEMTAGALNVLDNDENGFFLMVEGGATDWAAHDNQSGLMIEEEIAFNRAVDAVLAWVDANSNWGETLVVVVSDHETGYLTGPGSGATADGPVWNPVTNDGIGIQPVLQYGSVEHTNSLVPVYAKGDAGRLLRAMVDGTDPVRGPYIDNTDIHALLMAAVGLRK